MSTNNINRNLEEQNEPIKKKEFSSWEELNINPSLLRGIYAHGFEQPSPIQKKAIIPMIEGNDIIAQAQSGTGKTGRPASTWAMISRASTGEEIAPSRL